MKKILITFFLITCLAPLSFSQAGQIARRAITLGNKTVVPGTWMGNKIIDQVLAKRAQDSFQRAYQMKQLLEKQMPMSQVYGPSKSVSKFVEIAPQHLYPDAHFLVTQEQLAQYFLAQNNRAFLTFYPKFNKLQQEIIRRTEELQKHKIVPDIDPSQDMAWVAAQAPQDVRYFLIGETHDYPEIQQSVSSLLHEIRQRFTQQKIFLFSEFLSDGQVLPQKNFVATLPAYKEVWNTALREQITPVGLEPLALWAENDARISYPSARIFLGIQTMRTDDVRASLEGVRLRNRHWQKIVADYRQKYPDALFIIYTGAWHVEYNHPYNLAKTFNPSETFEVSLYPSLNLHALNKPNQTSALDLITDGAFPERVLKFDRQDLSRLVGFDVQVKVFTFPREQ